MFLNVWSRFWRNSSAGAATSSAASCSCRPSPRAWKRSAWRSMWSTRAARRTGAIIAKRTSSSPCGLLIVRSTRPSRPPNSSTPGSRASPRSWARKPRGHFDARELCGREPPGRALFGNAPAPRCARRNCATRVGYRAGAESASRALRSDEDDYVEVAATADAVVDAIATLKRDAGRYARLRRRCAVRAAEFSRRGLSEKWAETIRRVQQSVGVVAG